jgi:ATP-dependent Clp protease ATP-binding subunit ClpC
MTQGSSNWLNSLDASARGVLNRARDESDRTGLHYIGTEHLLLGLLTQSRGIGGRVLRSFGLDLDSTRAAFGQWRAASHEHAVASAEPQNSEGIRLSAEAKSAIGHAVDRARRGGTRAVSTEHLLAGLLDLEDGTAVDVLRGRGVDLVAMRGRTSQLLSEGGQTLRRGGRISPDFVGLHAVELPDWQAPASSSAVRNNVVMCRLDDSQIEAIDILIEAGVRANRSDAAAWLIRVGLESKASVVDAVREKVAEIRSLREDARTLAEGADAAG